MAESIAAANPYRYVRIYCGYGVRGLELLEEYRDWLEKNRSGPRQGKKKYKYGNVLRMPVEDWLDYIVRKAGRQKKYYLDLQAEQQNIYRVEKLTVTELMVLQYMEKGFSNAEISAKMNVKLPTVKSHIYNIYKKLGVTTRIQAVQKAKESGIL
jgi:DNA-binding CsgD family transcriptional regulator